MTKQEAQLLIGKWAYAQGLYWEETPLFMLWEDGDFPDDVESGDFDTALELLTSNYTLDSPAFDYLPEWCQIYICFMSEA